MKVIEDYITKLLSSSPDKPLWNIESIKLGRKPAWNYIDGCMISSLLELYKITNDKKYLNFIVNFVDFYVNDNGEILGFDPSKGSTDDICESRILFDLYDLTHEKKYLKAIEFTFEQVKNHQRTKEGNFWHKNIYPNQVWLDGLYMVMPFYTRYQASKDGDYKDIINQFQNVFNIMFDKKAELYYHAYDSSKESFWCDKETGLSKNFWLRSIGWYTIGLIDVYSYIKNDEESKEIIKNIFLKTINGILKYQDQESKMFYQVPNFPGREGNYLETSGSCMISYALLKSVRLGLLDKSYQQIGKEIFDGICKKYLTVNANNELNLGGICIMAGVGPESNKKRDGSYEYYISEPIVENDAKGVGPFIMAYTELLQIK